MFLYYGGTYLLWDKHFATYSTGPDHAVANGVKNSRLSCNPMWESNLPFLRLVGFRYLAKRLNVALVEASRPSPNGQNMKRNR